ncbi:MAG: TRAP transporter large permease subunit [Sandaracinaceae bacterium]|nr:MAG: TRAP transporter large permease subunit [Sandaracinaceae bacterium]HBQ12671.1 C4-dicarboxylate ABC transporter permease [Myxococcales bacterium]
MTDEAQKSRRKRSAFVVLVIAILVMPWLGPGPLLAALVLAAALIGMPLFALVGTVTIACFLLFTQDKEGLEDLVNLVERINELGDTENLLAVPLFMLSGSIMARGEISSRLIDFSKAMIGWLPGGLAVSAVVACMLFAAISGSSPATVVAIGAFMAPTLIKNGYKEEFAHGLLTSSGSLGILIPPSIPMILYPLINQRAGIETSRLFAAGFGPGLVIGGILAGYCIYRGIVGNSKRQPFSLKVLGEAFVDGFWSLLFPLLILGGIYTGFFTVVEASGISVVYAIAVEVYIHRALELKEIPKIVQETGVILGSLLVIMVAALAFSEFLHLERIPDVAVEWIQSLNLSPIAFLLILNLLLLVVGTLMDILSAMFLFVPLLAPIAESMGVDPMHFGIIFIVNLEIGYLTPPVGLNLFVASTLFNKPLGHMIRSVGPFIGLMFIGLMLITYFPALSVGLGNIITGDTEPETTAPSDPGQPLPDLPDDEMPSMDDMMDEADLEDGDEGVQSMEEMMQELEGLDADGEEDPGAEAPAPREPDRVMTMEEMMEAADVE